MPARELTLIRHAKAAWPDGVHDHDRPLTLTGQARARLVGEWVATSVTRPHLVLCSSALRTRSTWEIAAGAFGKKRPEVRVVPELYESSTSILLDLLRDLDADLRSVVVVGHEPTMSQFTVALAGPKSSQAHLAQVRADFPTNGIASLRVDGRWEKLTPGEAKLVTFAVPR